MKINTFNVTGPIEFIPAKLADDRGYFSETFRDETFRAATGPYTFVQDNQSLSTRAGTVRGLHFQTQPAAQGKLVRCVAGSLFDVAVDLRYDAPSYGKWIAVVLSAAIGNQFWVPPGFAHGFCTLELNTMVSYKLTAYYSRDDERGIAWDDADIGIVWPDIADPESLSAKDREQPAFGDTPALFALQD